MVVLHFFYLALPYGHQALDSDVSANERVLKSGTVR